MALEVRVRERIDGRRYYACIYDRVFDLRSEPIHNCQLAGVDASNHVKDLPTDLLAGDLASVVG